MQIHTVQKGDTVFKIARKYASSPMKIIENNELENPDRLTVGEKLLILTPTRTYNVRTSDTLERIAQRFGEKPEALLAKNPYLYGEGKLYPGQTLAIKYGEPRLGMASANGYAYRDIKKDRLMLALPYLVYVTVGAGMRVGDEVKMLFSDTDIKNTARKMGKRFLLRVYDGGEPLSEKYLEHLPVFLKKSGYDGVTLASYAAEKNSPREYAAFLTELRKRLMELDLLLYTETDGNLDTQVPDVCDGYIMTYGKCALSDIPSFNDGERAALHSYANRAEAIKTYLDIPTLAYMGDEEILIKDAKNIAQSAGVDIEYDKEKMICHFSYTRYKAGRGEAVRVAYESPENLKAKLDLVSELGYMGVSFDIMKIPVEYLMMFEASFSHPPIYADI